jgi:hypothetical protein
VQNRAIQRDTGHVNCGDLPPVLGQPDRVRAVAAADVERSAGRQLGHLGNQRTVG